MTRSDSAGLISALLLFCFAACTDSEGDEKLAPATSSGGDSAGDGGSPGNEPGLAGGNSSSDGGSDSDSGGAGPIMGTPTSPEPFGCKVFMDASPEMDFDTATLTEDGFIEYDAEESIFPPLLALSTPWQPKHLGYDALPLVLSAGHDGEGQAILASYSDAGEVLAMFATCADLTPYTTGLRFWLKTTPADGVELTLVTATADAFPGLDATDPEDRSHNGTCASKDIDDCMEIPELQLDPAPDWTQVEIHWSDFTPSENLDGDPFSLKSFGMYFRLKNTSEESTEISLALDDIEFLSEASSGGAGGSGGSGNSSAGGAGGSGGSSN
jgi:hypothetical protein